MKKILAVISSQNDLSPLADIFIELKSRGIEIKSATPKGTKNANIFPSSDGHMHFNFGPKADFENEEPGTYKLLFLLAYPFLLTKAFIFCIFKKFSDKYTVFLLSGYSSKVIFSLPCRIMRIQVIWLEPPFSKTDNLKGVLKSLLKFSSRKVKIICAVSMSKPKLIQQGTEEENILIVHPGINYKKHAHQDTIFENIAQHGHENSKKKYFTLGSFAVDIDSNFKLETLLHAVIKCKTVAPAVQAIVVSENEDIKNYSWLIKKMGLEGTVWLIGKQNNLRKWFENFDIFVELCSKPNLKNIDFTLKAMLAGLPLLAPQESKMDDFIFPQKNGLFYKAEDSESLAQCIIALEQNKKQRLVFGQTGKEMAINNFSIKQTVEAFESVFNK